MNKILYLFILFNIFSNAQSIKPASISSAASNLSDGQNNVRFTLGETVILKLVDENGNSIGSGFGSTQTAVLSVQEPQKNIIDVLVYPNPTSDLVHLDIKSTNLKSFQLNLYDLQGKLHLSQNHAALQQTYSVNLSHFATGVYMLHIKDFDSNLIATYKIIKN
jgi:hypothetical protein